MKITKKQKIILSITIAIILLFAEFLILSFNLKNQLVSEYKNRESVIITDRNGQILSIEPNSDGYYSQYLEVVPENFKELLLKKEDKYFYYHPGINPVSTARAFKNYLTRKPNLASSTLTQQLVKILLGQEQTRTWKNKFLELVYAISLETYLSKDEILTMYANSIYLGNQVQGLKLAAKLYYDESPILLSDNQTLELLQLL